MDFSAHLVQEEFLALCDGIGIISPEPALVRNRLAS